MSNNKSGFEKIVVKQGSSIKIGGDSDNMIEVTCNEIAKLAIAIRENICFFYTRRGIDAKFNIDINGSGTQSIEIIRISDNKCLIGVVCSTTSEKSNILYRGILLKDQDRDYKPSVSYGVRNFGADFSYIEIDWNSKEILQLRSDAERLSKCNPRNIYEWIDQDLDMIVKCRCYYRSIIKNIDLKRYADSNLSLQDLKYRLKCSKCGRRDAELFVSF